ncbi:zeta toxin family protein [Pseudomonas sp. NPDC087817]|uniref:zeta toxin family protein n=1 Tax=Pseudomonas sp. NPDC087817 TaxID=3364451 RepID=UPI00382F3022
MDGTLSNIEIARKNVQRCLDKGRFVQILYVYQDPRLAWSFVRAREEAEGRRIRPRHTRYDLMVMLGINDGATP